MSILLRERRSDGVEVLRLNRPQQRNAFDSALLGAVNDTLGELAADGDLRVVVFSTTDTDALSSGADVAEQLDADAGIARMEAFTRMYAAVETFPVPTIAVCVGHCVGAGAELAAGCDLRVGGDNLKARWVGARFGVPVGPARLAPLIGTARAKDLIFTSRLLEAEEAERIDFVRSVHPPDQAEAAALELAEQLTKQHAAGMRQVKRLFLELGDSTARVEQENRELIEFQRSGSGLPRR